MKRTADALVRNVRRTPRPAGALRGARAALSLVWLLVAAANAQPLAGTQPLTMEGDLSAQMVAGIDRWLTAETSRAAQQRGERWQIPRNDPPAAEKFLAAKRDALRKILGIADERHAGAFEIVMEPGVTRQPQNSAVRVDRVRWPVLDDVHGEGLLLWPEKYGPRAIVVVIPDADQTPESIAGLAPGEPPGALWSADGLVRPALRLAERGCLVLVPALVDRRDKWSGSERLKRFTNEPHREWIYRQAFEMGRTLIGYEVQKVQAGIDALQKLAPNLKLGVVGYGEGGLLALHAAALDPRIAATVVSGYFGPREALWQEPIYRNLFGLLRDFGDAEIAALVAPRRLFIEPIDAPQVDGPPQSPGRSGGAPGKISTPAFADVKAEVARANKITGSQSALLLDPRDASPFLTALELVGTTSSERAPFASFHISDEANDARQHRIVRQLEDHTQRLARLSEQVRAPALWSHLKPGPEFDAAQREVRRDLWENVIGKLPTEYLPPNARTRTVLDRPAWTAYEVVLDVLPEVFAWGWLLVPKDVKPGERRPVVVCQHGLEGLPEHTVSDDPAGPGWRFYKGFAARLAERGFIVYAPHNPYRGKDQFRLLQRKANPIGLSLFSFIVAQHDVTTRWLASLPFVDPERIAFYGLSYGGKTAMRVPALLDRYCLSICSGDFNEWIFKNVNTESLGNYPFTGEWEMPEWNMGHVASYAEMALLIAPRPFMVERGHDDGVGFDQRVSFEWGKVRRGYDKLGIPERAEIEWFDGPHTIHGEGTFKFLHRHLRWPGR